VSDLFRIAMEEAHAPGRQKAGVAWRGLLCFKGSQLKADSATELAKYFNC
jgi:hypothetical protein